MSKIAEKKMAKNTKCPQCGSEISLNEYYKTPRCAVCGWGMLENAVVSEPPSGFKHYVRTKSMRWKFGVAALSIIALLVISPLLGVVSSNVMANQAVAKAATQMKNRLYASAARTLNKAPRPAFASAKSKNMNKMTGDTIRYAQDNKDVRTAKTALESEDPNAAFDALDDIDEDFPQEDEAGELEDYAQELEIDPELEFEDGFWDEVAPTPDDPELDNLPELAEEADVPVPAAPTATTTPSTTTSPTTQDPEDSNASEVTNEPVNETELPDAPKTTAVAGQPVTTQTSTLTPLYQLNWQNKAANPTDQDSFYTVDLDGEATPRKDKRSNFSGYGVRNQIGQIYKRAVPNNTNIVPLYRYWNVSKTNHFYTTNSKFASSGKNTGYIRQQIAGYIGKWNGSTCAEGTKPLYNIYNPSLSDNFYTTDIALKDRMVSNQGWKNPKVTGCIW